MKKLAIVMAVAGLIGTPAFAADMAVKGPPPAPAPVYNWTGWYAGVNLGASFGNVKTDFNKDPVVISAGSATAAFSTPFAGSDRVYPSGFVGGGQIGYNWQYSPLIVVGLEADIQGALERESRTPSNNSFTSLAVLSPGFPIGPDCCTLTGTAVTNYTTKIEWFGTARLRAGYVWGDGNVLTYVTGGLAYGKVDFEGTSIVSGTNIPFSVAQSFNHNAINTGWVVGFGTEGRLLIPGWTYKIESLYMDLGTLDTSGVVTSIKNPGVPFVVTGPGLVHTHSHFTDGILRLGVNYQFH
jgi:outer membrane immunogenic protein